LINKPELLPADNMSYTKKAKSRKVKKIKSTLAAEISLKNELDNGGELLG